ncbi:acetyl-CoA acetyltransferase [Corynebacterium sanguinis]|uniref:acetyl-CoA acetyltransferase n=1 Tax=Corynebacterium sanguinis TaxID=2594913 RepID=UPI00223B3977|nr:acetyl-CoA acetyltransferase [Corynebacterium sanguinis]MCT1585050.1 acetyl-CoA acetyltransferase [Corynebacterium sanguinis]MCT2024263.1 acetyl-CoA acetyltransferase [Corynebacterium sanguinis]
MAPTATSTAHSTRSVTTFAPAEDRDPFQIRFEIDQKLPKELRAEAQGMDWGLFKATYAPTPTMHIGLTDIQKLNWSDHRYTAEVSHTSKTTSPSTTVCEVTASGPAAAISEILSSNGRYVEILAFHQINLFEATLTCVKVAHQVNHNRTAWAVGFGHSPAHSIAAALSSGAQRIYGNF